MPVKHIISPGIGFSPGSIKYIVTRGLSIGAGYFTWRGPPAFAGFRDNRDYSGYTESRAFASIRDTRSFNDD